MRELLISDLHLTGAPRDEYRFNVFDAVRKVPVDKLWILGDLTDAKDYHSGQLVNRICNELQTTLAETNLEIHIVRGNHDGIDPDWPFFRFLRFHPQIYYYASVQEAHGDRNTLVLPHSRDPQRDWKTIRWEKYKRVMAHATFTGSIAENGVQIGDVPIPPVKVGTAIYSGDVHVPQKLGPVMYVGSPHHVRYGDKFSPRMLLLEKGMTQSIPLPGVSRWLVDIQRPQDLQNGIGVKAGDQIKVRLHVSEEDLVKFAEMRKEVLEKCRILKLDVAGVELVREASKTSLLRAHAVKQVPEEVFTAYVERNKTPKEFVQAGLDVLNSDG